MLYLANIITLALLSKAFGSYASALLNMQGSLFYTNIFALLIITLLGIVQYFGIKIRKPYNSISKFLYYLYPVATQVSVKH